MRNNMSFASGSFPSFDGTHIHYEISGNKNFQQTIVFLHGLGGNLTAWDPEVSHAISQGYTTITLDLRGHGLSDRPTRLNAYAISAFAKDIAILLTLYPIKNVTLIGQCLGGVIAQELVKNKHIKPHALILIGTTAQIPWYFSLVYYSHILSGIFSLSQLLKITRWKRDYMAVFNYQGTGDFDLRRFFADLTYTSIPSYVATCHQLFAWGKSSDATYVCPVLILHGSNDHIFPIQYARALQKQIPHARFVTIPQGNHILVLNNPLTLTQQITQFLQEY